MILAVSSVLMGRCSVRTLCLLTKNLLVCCSWALPVMFVASLEDKRANEEHEHRKRWDLQTVSIFLCDISPPARTTQSPDEDALLSGRLDVTSDYLARLQGVHGQNLRVLGWFGVFRVQSGENQLVSYD